MDGKNVLVTGANGHVGFVLTKFLVERGYNVRASVRDKNNPELVSHLSSLDVEIFHLLAVSAAAPPRNRVEAMRLPARRVLKLQKFIS